MQLLQGYLPTSSAEHQKSRFELASRPLMACDEMTGSGYRAVSFP